MPMHIAMCMPDIGLHDLLARPVGESDGLIGFTTASSLATHHL